MARMISHMIRGAALIVASLTAIIAAPAQANSQIELQSQVFVERIIKNGDRSAVQLEKPEQVLPGDKLIFILRYRNTGNSPVTDFVITNPLPEAVAFQETLDGSEEVSVDGGKSWGRLKNLRISKGNGRFRAAFPADVTHIRWSILQVITKGSEGKLTFRGVVK